MKNLNPTINCTPVNEMLTFENAMDLVSKHDCVIDACDNPQTRYLVNDACILNKKPLVSGSAMGTEGQLTVYGYKDSACYRCLYPRVNPTEGGKSCSFAYVRKNFSLQKNPFMLIKTRKLTSLKYF